ncbi:MAG: alpha/beta hydrolase, partial [Bacteroidetes bacterium]|nr:alpha/beta hydrolase [Bacteroidota bacterium]
IKLLSNLPYNYHPYDWAEKDFHPQFKATWIPKNIPTLIIAGDHDILTPIEAFKSDSRFNKHNIKYKLINDASHFPWVEQPDEVFSAIAEFKEGISVKN